MSANLLFKINLKAKPTKVFEQIFTFKVLNGNVPDYIQSLVSLDQPSRSLCSSDKVYKLKEHRWKLKSRGSRPFHIAAPCYWNRLPDDIHDIIKLNLIEFKNDSKYFV